MEDEVWLKDFTCQQFWEGDSTRCYPLKIYINYVVCFLLSYLILATVMRDHFTTFQPTNCPINPLHTPCSWAHLAHITAHIPAHISLYVKHFKRVFILTCLLCSLPSFFKLLTTQTTRQLRPFFTFSFDFVSLSTLLLLLLPLLYKIIFIFALSTRSINLMPRREFNKRKAHTARQIQAKL